MNRPVVPLFFRFCILVPLGFVGSALAQEKVTYNDQLLPLIEQHCAKCHNADKRKGDLELTSYQGALKGGGSGPVVVAGNPDASKLWKAVTQTEEPTMPPNKPPLPEKDLAVFKKWIAGGLLENSGSKAIAAAKPAIDLSVKISSAGKPDGPPPMPVELSLEPIVRTAHRTAINGLAASPWAPLVAIAGQKQILLYHTTTLELLGILPFDQGQPWDLKFSRSGKLLIAAGGHSAQSGRVLLWNIETGERLATLGNEYDTVLAADLTPDQSRVALGGPDRLIKIYSTKTGELEHKIKKHTDWVTALAFSPNGEFLASGDRNGGVSLWDADNGQELFTTAGHKSAVTAVAWRGDSKVVASSSEDGSVKLWETSEGKQAKTWTAHGTGVLGVNYAHDGKLVTSGRDGAVATWSADGSKLRSLEFFGEPAVRCAFSHDDARVIAADFAGRVAVWDAQSGRRLGELEANPRSLAEQLTAARQRLEELSSNAPPAAVAGNGAEADVAKIEKEADAARTAAEKAKLDFAAKAKEVVRLKELAALASPPPEVAEQLATARAVREKSRAVNTAAAAALDDKLKQLAAAQEKVAPVKKAENRQAELAAAEALVRRLTVAQSFNSLSLARAAVTAKQRDLARGQADASAKQEEIKKLTDELGKSRDSKEKTRLKKDLKTANTDLKSAEVSVKKLADELNAAQAQLDQLATEHARLKTSQPPKS